MSATSSGSVEAILEACRARLRAMGREDSASAAVSARTELASLCEAWHLEDEATLRALGEHLADKLVEDLARPLSSEGIRELCVAFAAQRGIGSALSELRARVDAVTRRVGGKHGASAAQVDELRQAVESSLFIGAGGPPGALRFSGRGPLDAWLHASAVRIYWRTRDSDRRETTDTPDLVGGLEDNLVDPELALIRAHDGGEFIRAFRGAVASLTSRERNLLRLYVLQGKSLEAIGHAYGVHLATVSRWLSTCREQLLRRTRERLAESLRASPSELESLIRVLDGRIELSLSSALRSQEGEGG